MQQFKNSETHETISIQLETARLRVTSKIKKKNHRYEEAVFLVRREKETGWLVSWPRTDESGATRLSQDGAD